LFLINPAVNPNDSQISCAISGRFAEWLEICNGSVVISTYQAGKLAIVSWDGQQPSLLLRDFDKPMGLAIAGHRMALATRHEVTVFADAPLLAPEYLPNEPGKYDALFLPRVTYHTGDLNVHDLAFGKEGLWLVNTRFGCLAGLSHDHCFIPRWKPPFLTDLAPEDRCHLNGLAMIAGEPAFVTALGRSDTVGGWRENKATGGVVLQVPSGDVAVSGLAMPHSPRFQKDRLWFLNSGAGELCCHTPGTSSHEVICRLPAYLRGLCLMGDLALVGMCQIREKHIFGGLPIQATAEPLVCGVALVDLVRGIELGRFTFTSGCTEIFEVQFVPHLKRPMVFNSQQESAHQAFPAPAFSYWLRPANLLSAD
jgi:uncharacterized protein (TIGR03032 family)